MREIAEEYSGDYMLRFQADAILALQESTESYLVHLFEDAFVLPFLLFPLHSLFPLPILLFQFIIFIKTQY